MTVKSLFKDSKVLAAISPDEITGSVESYEYAVESLIERDRFVPQVDFSDPANFVKFGSAERYYLDSIKRIYEDYPFDGSLKERTSWLNSSSYLDRHIFEHEYPRSTGYVKFSPAGWGTAITASVTGFGYPTTLEYITVKGGPNVGPNGDREGANVYSVDDFRTSNLRFGGDYGNTVEFWLKKGEVVPAATSKEVIFDLWNGVSASFGAGSNYGRFLVYLDGTSSYPSSALRVTYVSGTVNACSDVAVGTVTAATSSILDEEWHHLAVSCKNQGASDLVVSLYVDGKLDDETTVSNGAIAEVTGPLAATVGALLTSSGPGEEPAAGIGWGKLSGSLDEFRFWKKKRTIQEVGRHWFTQVGGGTNSDDANTDLGVYFKFNEGLVGSSSYDSKILDYSGRLSHGTFIGYDSSHRSTGSAMVESSAAEAEFEDPIIYSVHPDVSALETEKQLSGSYYDLTNNSSLYHSMPTWIVEEDERDEKYNLMYLTQILSSYLDNLYLQIKELPKLRNINYGVLSGSSKPYPFVERALESQGFSVSEIFEDASALIQLASRDEKREFERKIYDIKNAILHNIYNNLSYINKTKGTSRAIRNVLRCFGVGDEVVRVNLYPNNAQFLLEDNYNPVAAKKRLVDFNNVDRFSGVVYQYSSSSPESVSYLTSSGLSHEASGSSVTFEAEFVFPRKVEESSELYFETPFISASLFGSHDAKVADASDMTWATSDVGNFQVSAVRDSLESKNVYFVLTSSLGGHIPLLTSSLFGNVYDNQKWTFAVAVRPSKYPMYLGVSGSDKNLFDVEFRGQNLIYDQVRESFSVSGSISFAHGSEVLSSPKRLFVGAHRTNFTGSALTRTDVKCSFARIWLDYLSEGEQRQHARDPYNYGVEVPLENTAFFKPNLRNIEVPRAKALALNWDFSLVTGSDASGQFVVEDVSSGSADLVNRYGWISTVGLRQHTGRGDFFLADDSSAIDVDYLYSARQQLPEILNSDSMVSILTQDDDTFGKENRPVSYFVSIEKSPAQVVSEEILNMFATVRDFNDLIGNPVNRYRQEYKELEKLRNLFFERVENIPRVEKFFDYYKWFDSALTQMIGQLVPASADISENIENVIESHILERNKYWTKFPTMEFKNQVPEGGTHGINELLVPWKTGHRPTNNLQSFNRFYWQQLAERDTRPLSSSNAAVNIGRTAILTASVQIFERKLTTPYRQAVDYNGFVKRDPNKRDSSFLISNTKYGNPNQYLFISGGWIHDNTSGNFDEKPETTKTKLDVQVYVNNLSASFKSDLVLPVSFYSSSIRTGYNRNIPNITVADLHEDSYGTKTAVEGVMQGPFTEKHVGGREYRHAMINSAALDTRLTRAEGWKFLPSAGNYYFASSEMTGAASSDKRIPAAKYYRDELAKRPVNVRNIIGDNYQKAWNVVQTCGRSENNRALAISESFVNSSPSTYIGGTADYTKPVRGRHEHIFVQRFSAPGSPETAGDSNGGVGLDVEAAEFSIYNSMNFRNLIVRDGLKTLQTQHCGIYGTDALAGIVTPLSYESSASYHKINRNSRKKIVDSPFGGYGGLDTASSFDNWYVTHQIPQSESGYYWISASAVILPFGLSSCSTDITFGTASAYGNICAFDSASLTDSIGIISNRDGLYQYPSWKQIRAGESKNAVYNKQHNIISIMKPSDVTVVSSEDSRLAIKAQRNPDLISYRDAPITSRYKAFVTELTVDDDGVKTRCNIKHTYGNNLVSFATPELNNALGLNRCNDKQFHDQLLDEYRDPDKFVENDGVNDFHSFTYEETVYPPESTSYISFRRTRENFKDPIWTEDRAARTVTNATNSQGFVIPFQSSWPMDARQDFETAVPITGSPGAEGELQNKYTTYFKCDSTQPFDPGLIGSAVSKVVYFGPYYQNEFGTGLGHISDYNNIMAPFNTWEDLLGGAAADKLTISMWVMPLSNSIGTGTGEPAKQTIINFNDGAMHFYLISGSTYDVRRIGFSASCDLAALVVEDEWHTTASCVNINEWTHVAVTYDRAAAVATAVNFYVNGLLIDQPAAPVTYVAPDLRVSDFGVEPEAIIGNDYENSGSHIAPFEGYMSNFSIFTGTLSSAEISEIYNGGTVKSLYEFSAPEKIVSWFPLGDGVGWDVSTGTGRLRVTHDGRTLGSANQMHDRILGNEFGWEENRIWDMVGEYGGASLYMEGAVSASVYVSVSDTTWYTPNGMPDNEVSDRYPEKLLGVSQATRSDLDVDWMSCFAVGAMYSRPVVEYTSTPWPRVSLGGVSYDRQIHVTGAYIVAGDTEWTISSGSLRNRNYLSYQDYSEDLRVHGKDGTIVPEFRVSELMDFYVNENGGNFLVDAPDFLSLTGAMLQSSSEDGFFATYSHSEFLKYFDVVREQHKEVGEETELTLKCTGVLKLLPYEGFFPAERTIQMATLFSQSYGDFVEPYGYGDSSNKTGSWRAFLSPIFGPGLVYNSIKAGMAVDFPVYTEYPEIQQDYKAGVGGWDIAVGGYEHEPAQSLTVTTRGLYGSSVNAATSSWFTTYDSYWYSLYSSSYVDAGATPLTSDDAAEFQSVLASPFTARLPFSALVEPENYLAKGPLWDMEPAYSASLRAVYSDPTTNQAAMWGGQGKQTYKMAMHNFLAETPSFFLKDGKLTGFSSDSIPPEGIVITEEDANQFFGMDVAICNSQCRNLTDWHKRRSLPQFAAEVDDSYSISEEEMDEIKGIHTQNYSRDSAFGPPWVYPDSIFTGSDSAFRFHYSYEPFTPSYFNGYGLARFLFFPFRGAGNYTLEEIQSHLTASYFRFPTNRVKVGGVHNTNAIMDWSTALAMDQNLLVSGTSFLPNISHPYVFASAIYSASLNWMHIDATVDLLGKTKVKKTSFSQDSSGQYLPVVVDDNPKDSDQIWTIAMKWETPILNFKNTIFTDDGLFHD